MILYIITWTLIFSYILYIIFLYLLKSKINKLENKIKKSFNKRTNLITSLFEVTKWILNKHDDIFKDILALRIKEFNQIEYEKNIQEIFYNESKIHFELNFIFRICISNKKLEKNWNFLYIKDLIFWKSEEIWKSIQLYKNIIKKYNKFIYIKNLSIIWLLIPINYITEI